MDGTRAGVQPHQGGPRQQGEARPARPALGSQVSGATGHFLSLTPEVASPAGFLG